jgi:hypothetical protein
VRAGRPTSSSAYPSVFFRESPSIFGKSLSIAHPNESVEKVSLPIFERCKLLISLGVKIVKVAVLGFYTASTTTLTGAAPGSNDELKGT